MTRRQLPNRRPCLTVETTWQGIPLTVTTGFYPDATPGEVFADANDAAARHGQIGNIIRDACTAASVAMQHGVPPAALAKSLGRVPVHKIRAGEVVQVEAPASPLGPILAAVMEASE